MSTQENVSLVARLADDAADDLCEHFGPCTAFARHEEADSKVYFKGDRIATIRRDGDRMVVEANRWENGEPVTMRRHISAPDIDCRVVEAVLGEAVYRQTELDAEASSLADPCG